MDRRAVRGARALSGACTVLAVPDTPALDSRSFDLLVFPGSDLAAAEQVILARPKAELVERTSLSASFRLGSRFVFRMWGALGPSRKQLPMVVELRGVRSGREAILIFRKDTPGFLFTVPAVDRLFEQQFNEIARAVQDAVNASRGAVGGLA